jgi:hypothetical protein
MTKGGESFVTGAKDFPETEAAKESAQDLAPVDSATVDCKQRKNKTSDLCMFWTKTKPDYRDE